MSLDDFERALATPPAPMLGGRPVHHFRERKCVGENACDDCRGWGVPRALLHLPPSPTDEPCSWCSGSGVDPHADLGPEARAESRRARARLGLRADVDGDGCAG